MKNHSVGGIVVNSGGEVLVVNQYGESWSLPKGHIEDEEDELATAVREIREESGITRLTLVKKLETYERSRIDQPDEIKTITMYLFTTDEADLAPSDPNNPEARWVSAERVADLLTHTRDKQFFTAHLVDIEQLKTA